MKNALKIFGVLCITALYSMAVFTENEADINASFFLDSDAYSSGYFTDQSATLYSHTNPNVNVVYDFTSSSFPKVKDPLQSFKAMVSVSGHIANTKFLQYSLFNTNYPVAFSKPDIVFPFHYFL